jgi:hypothetical protein
MERSAKAGGTAPSANRCASPLNDRRLADTGGTYQNRTVFRATGEYLERTLNFALAPDERFQFAFARTLREIVGGFLDGGNGSRGPGRGFDQAPRLFPQLPCCKPVIQHNLRSEAVGFPRESQQQVFQFEVGTAKHFCLFRAISHTRLLS